jgi:probable phosphoglycerate mutase
MSRPEIVLIRHGETEWSSTGRHTGRTDIPLTERGRRQAVEIRSAVDGWTFSHVFASPLRRAWETAELTGLSPVRDDGLLEWDYGIYEGVTTPETRETISDWSAWTHPIEDGESLENVAARADDVIERVCRFDGPIALVAHGHLLRVLGARWLGLEPVEGRRFVLDTTALCILGWERENRVVRRWNDPCGRP